MPTSASEVPVSTALPPPSSEHGSPAPTQATEAPASEPPASERPTPAPAPSVNDTAADRVERTETAAPRTGRARPKRRTRRFALPDMAADKRADEAIEAFLEGPDLRRHKPAPKRRRRKPAAEGTAGHALQVAERRFAVMPRPSTDIRTLPGRIEWNAALERESLRSLRYGSSAAVAIVELVGERPKAPADPWMRILAGPIARTLRGGSRATDLVARVATARFHVLLPETPEAGAARFVERMSAACRDSIEDAGVPVMLRVCVASATPEHSLHEALNEALRTIEAA